MTGIKIAMDTIDGAFALRTDVEAARDYAAAAKAPNTLRAYRGAWEAFEAWAQERGVAPLPAPPAIVASYLAHRATEGAKPASLALYLSAITEAHRAAGGDAKALRASAEVRAVMAGIRRTHGAAQRQASPATAEVLRAVVPGLGTDLGGLRDRALVTLGFAGAFRRSELVALDVADLVFSPRGVEVRVRRSKTDQAGEGRIAAIPFASGEVCPVRALRAWLDAAQLTSGPVFRAVDRWGKIGGRLDGRDVARIVKRTVQASGLDPQPFSGHSLRSGLATSAALAGKSDRAIMAQGRWKGRAMVDRYVRAADAWKDNAATGIL
jgi:site-specific recombinase XerD